SSQKTPHKNTRKCQWKRPRPGSRKPFFHFLNYDFVKLTE
ncbi:MAG: hypothetical protein ACI9QN_000554, partial [Arcticibacterium sp.]